MKLMYRGVAYEYSPYTETVTTESTVAQASSVEKQSATELHYRGAAYFTRLGKPSIHELLCYPIRKLLYRGANYDLHRCVTN